VSLPHSNSEYCFDCGLCCRIHPCALSPQDLPVIAEQFGLSEGELFSRYLIIDYATVSRKKQYYICPARKAGPIGEVASLEWTFLDSPCIFLVENRCTIQEVKPRGGREFFCRLVGAPNHNAIGYSKKMSAGDWYKSRLLDFLLQLTERRATLEKVSG
jgi:hypothetical protein